jgi:hypothetical protein
MKTTHSLEELKQAKAEGKQILFSLRNDLKGAWRHIAQPRFDRPLHLYRIKA